MKACFIFQSFHSYLLHTNFFNININENNSHKHLARVVFNSQTPPSILSEHFIIIYLPNHTLIRNPCRQNKFQTVKQKQISVNTTPSPLLCPETTSIFFFLPPSVRNEVPSSIRYSGSGQPE